MEASTNPLVSVVIPSFNAEKFLLEAVESVLGQTYEHLEVIVVDDGSSRPQAECVSTIADGRLRVIRQENGGTGRARNLGVQKSRGAFIAFLDADDLWLPKKLERQLRDFADDSVRVGFCDTYWKRGNTIATRTRFQGLDVPTGLILEPLLKHNFLPLSTAVLPRETFLGVGGFCEDRRIWEDWDLWLRLAPEVRFVYVPDALATYRVHEANSSGDREKSLARAMATLDRLQSAAPTIARSHALVVRESMANLLFELGYGRLLEGRRGAARDALWTALKLRPNHLKTLKVLVESFIPGFRPRVQPDPVFGEPARIGFA